MAGPADPGRNPLAGTKAHTRRGALKKQLALLLGLLLTTACTPLRGTGDLGIVIERAAGSIKLVENTTNTSLGAVEGLGDLSHASAVFSRDERYVYIFGRDGGLSKVDLLNQSLVNRVVQAGNSIGGAISQDGKWVAVANYAPGGVRIFDADSLQPVADIPAQHGDGSRSKVVGLEDAPGNRFIFSLFDFGEIWLAEMDNPQQPRITRYEGIGSQPYDALVTLDGRAYVAGLFGEDGLAMLDLWNTDKGVRRVMDHYGRGKEKLPVYKMPHLEGWAMAGNLAFLPAIGAKEVLVVDGESWQEKARIPVLGQPVFVMARPDGRQIWVNFALPDNDAIQVIDVKEMKVVKTMRPGKGVLHLEFTARGERVWISLRDEDRVEVYHTDTFEKLATLPADKPSGIFFTWRAHRIGL
ncbi:MAG: protein nirF [Magnetococcales bacterium]|nr:protein nirF [Magnetococcales bacterium]NGZ25303.1 protein nirF [Magnetococcales bacterium]